MTLRRRDLEKRFEIMKIGEALANRKQEQRLDFKCKATNDAYMLKNQILCVLNPFFNLYFCLT